MLVRFRRGTFLYAENPCQIRVFVLHVPNYFLKTTTKEVAQIEIWMNNYPRKMFNYSTPIQVYLGG